MVLKLLPVPPENKPDGFRDRLMKAAETMRFTEEAAVGARILMGEIFDKIHADVDAELAAEGLPEAEHLATIFKITINEALMCLILDSNVKLAEAVERQLK